MGAGLIFDFTIQNKLLHVRPNADDLSEVIQSGEVPCSNFKS